MERVRADAVPPSGLRDRVEGGRRAANPSTAETDGRAYIASVSALGGPTRIETPPRRFTSANPSSSVVSSPTNTGIRPRNGCSAMNAAIAPCLAVMARLQLEYHLAGDQPQRLAVLAQHARSIADPISAAFSGAAR